MNRSRHLHKARHEKQARQADGNRLAHKAQLQKQARDQESEEDWLSKQLRRNFGITGNIIDDLTNFGRAFTDFLEGVSDLDAVYRDTTLAPRFPLVMAMMTKSLALKSAKRVALSNSMDPVLVIVELAGRPNAHEVLEAQHELDCTFTNRQRWGDYQGNTYGERTIRSVGVPHDVAITACQETRSGNPGLLILPIHLVWLCDKCVGHSIVAVVDIPQKTVEIYDSQQPSPPDDAVYQHTWLSICKASPQLGPFTHYKFTNPCTSSTQGPVDRVCLMLSWMYCFCRVATGDGRAACSLIADVFRHANQTIAPDTRPLAYQVMFLICSLYDEGCAWLDKLGYQDGMADSHNAYLDLIVDDPEGTLLQGFGESSRLGRVMHNFLRGVYAPLPDDDDDW